MMLPPKSGHGFRGVIMSKYSFEFKLKVVKEYMGGETGGYKSVAKKYDIKNHSLIIYQLLLQKGKRRTN
jgi:transposase-like protein